VTAKIQSRATAADGGAPGQDFLRRIVRRDVEAGLWDGLVRTRFPPEPNGFLHIGHASAIVLNFSVGAEFGGETNLRMDDTNPVSGSGDFVEAAVEDVRWLGYEWEGGVRYASDYYGALYRMAEQMVLDGLAYVDSLDEEQIRRLRGTVTSPGTPGPYRDRPPDESLDLLRRMRDGEFADGECVLRAKIDMAATNMKMRDPLMYRIRHQAHYRTGTRWAIYPLYDWAHGQSDAIEGITHSFCTLEFSDNRELYDWYLDHCRPSAAFAEPVPGARGGGGDDRGSWNPRPRQYEFARRELDYAVVSKRKLRALVSEGLVDGWDDPRMLTLAGLRRRGAPPEAIRRLCRTIGVGKADNRTDIGKLEWALRTTLNETAPRVLAVLDPLEVVVENLPPDHEEILETPYFPPDVTAPPAGFPARRKVPFTQTLFIERADFSEDPPGGFKRMAPGRTVRLRHAYCVTCTGFDRSPDGSVARVRCTYDPATRSGGDLADGPKPTGAIHWVSARRCLSAEVRLYDRLFAVPDPEADGDFRDRINPDSRHVFADARTEISLAGSRTGDRFQFERTGYFVRDGANGGGGVEGKASFNLIVTLRDSWARRIDRTRGETPAATAPWAAPGEDTGRKARDHARASNLELEAAFRRLRDELDLGDVLADLVTASPARTAFFEQALAASDPSPAAVAVATWIVHEVAGAGGETEDSRLSPEALGELVAMVEQRRITRPGAKDILARLIAEGGRPVDLAAQADLVPISDADQVRELVEEAFAAHQEEAARFEAGEGQLLGFFIGRIIRSSGGRVDPTAVRTALQARANNTAGTAG